MNAERLHAISTVLRGEIDSRDVLGNLQNLVNACQQLSNQQSNTGLQQNFASFRDSFYKSVTDTPSDKFAPTWRQVLVELGGDQLFGQSLKERVERILAENQVTLVVAYQKLDSILNDLRNFHKSLTQLTDGLASFKIGKEVLEPGEAEIAVLIPRAAVHSRLDEFADELNELKFILNTFSEVSTGHADELHIRTVSSSDLSVYLKASPRFGAMVAKVVTFLVNTYKTILEIKRISQEIAKANMPDEFVEKTAEYANGHMRREIEKFAVEIVHEYPHQSDNGTKNELALKVRASLEKMANRIDDGFNFEVRIEAPKTANQDPQIKQDVATIQAATVQMQFMRISGPRILSLPGKIEEAPKKHKEEKQKKKPTRQIELNEE